MAKAEEVLERKVIHAGKVFIKAGEEHARAYVVQNGLIKAYVMDGDQRVDVADYEPGRIIGETCLMVDEPMTMNYEAVVDTTVVTITRQDFQKKISRIDKDINTILNHVMNKLNYQDLSAIDVARKRSKIDPDAFKMVDVLTASLPPERKFKYQNAILPHVNAMIKAIKDLKAEEKGSKAAVS
jgi:CRP-like cAMP-binding protein